MSALSDFIEVMKRQRYLLEAASLRDDRALGLVERGDERERKIGQRKVWTRQDANRFESECDWRENKNQPVGIHRVLCLPQGPETRQRTRVEWMVRLVTKPSTSLDKWRLLAMEEARQQGTYAAIAPLLIIATEAHKYTVDMFGGNRDFEQGDDWQSLRTNHDEAIERLEAHVLPLCPGDDAGWLNQTETARKLGVKRQDVHRLVGNGELKTNGASGRECLVDPASILDYCNKEGITYNET